MPYTLKQARIEQDKAKQEGKMSDVAWWSGYMAAIIDHDFLPCLKEKGIIYKVTLTNSVRPRAGQIHHQQI